MRDTHASTLLLLLAGIMAAAWMYCAQAGDAGWADDFPYSHTLVEGSGEADFFNCGGAPLTSVRQLPATFAAHYHAVNGRLANMLAFTLSLMPAILTALLHGAAFMLLTGALLRLAFGAEWRRHYLAVVVAASSLWLVLPWQENLASADYYINYVWSAGLNLLFLSLILRPSPRPHLLPLCLLSAVAAMMHEGMSVAIDAGILIFILINRRKSINLPPLCIYMLSSLVPMLSPGIWGLAGERSGAQYAYNFFSYVIGVRLAVVWAAAAVALLRPARKRLHREEAVIWTVIIAGIAVGIISHQGGRAFWLPMTLSLTLLFHCIRPRLSRRMKIAATLTCTAALCAWGALLCAWQYYASRERDTLLAAMCGGKEVIYMDLMMPDELPWPLMMTVSHVNGDQTIRANISAEIFGDARHAFAVLPASWRGKEFAELPALPGNLHVRGGAYTFLSTRPVKTAVYTHRLADASVALNPLYALPRRLSGGTAKQQVLIESTPAAPGLWVCRPLLYARSLLGFPVVAVDSVE